MRLRAETGTPQTYTQSDETTVTIPGDIPRSQTRAQPLRSPRRCAFPGCPRFTSRKSRDCSRRTTADSPASDHCIPLTRTASQATRNAVVPFRDRKQSRLPRKSFVRSQKASAAGPRLRETGEFGSCLANRFADGARACAPMAPLLTRLAVAPKLVCPRRGCLRNGTARAPSTTARRRLVPPPSTPKALKL